MTSGDGFGLSGDLSHFDPHLWDKHHLLSLPHPSPPMELGNVTRMYSFIVNPRGDNIFLHVSPNEGHQIIAA